MVIAWGLVLTITTLAATAIRYCVVFPRQPNPTGHEQPLDDNVRATALDLEAHIRAVASIPHNIEHPAALEAAAAYIEATLQHFGYGPIRHVFSVGKAQVRNIEVVIEPQFADRTTKTLVIGAHYDSAGDCPGANDNATGVAALLEIARGLAGAKSIYRLRLVFFVNEEHPYGKTPDMGSYRHAQALKASGESVVGMLALETLGHFSQKPGSQKFPFPFGLIFPDRGNFVAFVGMLRGRALVNTFVATFRTASTFPAIGAVAPAFIEGADLSDHWSYDHFGYPACMVTDTAPYRNPFYHSVRDTPDTVDYANLARVTHALTATITALAGIPACNARTPIAAVVSAR